MERLWPSLTATVAFFVASSGVFAADLGRPPPPVTPIAMYYDWTGFYIGGNVGGAWASGTLTDNLTGASFTGNHSGVIGGGTIGYNWQVSPIFVFGIEGTFDGASIGKASNLVVTQFGTLQGGAGTNWAATLAGRFGYAANNWLLYAKGGGGWADNTATITNWTTSGLVSASHTNSGWLAGVGIEYAFTPNWTMKVEYDYLGVPSWSFPTGFAAADAFTLTRQINMVTVGVNYKLQYSPGIPPWF